MQKEDDSILTDLRGGTGNRMCGEIQYSKATGISGKNKYSSKGYESTDRIESQNNSAQRFRVTNLDNLEYPAECAGQPCRHKWVNHLQTALWTALPDAKPGHSTCKDLKANKGGGGKNTAATQPEEGKRLRAATTPTLETLEQKRSQETMRIAGNMPASIHVKSCRIRLGLQQLTRCAFASYLRVKFRVKSW